LYAPLPPPYTRLVSRAPIECTGNRPSKHLPTVYVVTRLRVGDNSKLSLSLRVTGRGFQASFRVLASLSSLCMLACTRATLVKVIRKTAS